MKNVYLQLTCTILSKNQNPSYKSVNSLTLHSKIDVAPLGYYPDFEPTSPCSYSIMMGA
jgi:hypothetical protein